MRMLRKTLLHLRKSIIWKIPSIKLEVRFAIITTLTDPARQEKVYNIYWFGINRGCTSKMHVSSTYSCKEIGSATTAFKLRLYNCSFSFSVLESIFIIYLSIYVWRLKHQETTWSVRFQSGQEITWKGASFANFYNKPDNSPHRIIRMWITKLIFNEYI